mmetsp:Transcript_27009/g.44987  ORF Transcript_27009/g.44987 Transcript_27009/m.44987 type:complete len:292 (-) Transcript_27009:354-1229(-)
MQLFNAIDNAMDSGGHTVVVASDWVIEWMSVFFPDEASWQQLESHFPIVRDSADLKLELLDFTTDEIMSRNHPDLQERAPWNVVQARRVKLLHYMFSNLEGEPCNFLHHVDGFLQGKYTQSKYVAVHVRHMEGMCELFNDSPFRHEQCSMSPSYIKSIMESNGGDVEKLPIVLISDMQDSVKLHRIQDELDQVVVPEWDLTGLEKNDKLLTPPLDDGPTQSIVADLVVGAMSEIFIGEQGSSASRNIGILREAFGKPVSTNYIFMDKTAEGDWTSFNPKRPYAWWVGEEKK